MRIDPFKSERLLSTWQNRVQYDLTETGVHPLTLEELITREELDDLYRSTRLRYIQTNGTPGLKAAVCELYQGAVPENVMITNGSAEANFITLWRLLEPGDEVVAVVPNYMQVPGIARAFGATLKTCLLDERRAWRPDLEELRNLVSAKTKLVYLSNPNNPTGAILTSDEMASIVATVDSVGAWLLADEVYRGAELDGVPTPSFWGSHPRALVVAGLSKAYTLPGLRIGWLVGPSDLVSEIWGYHDYTTITTNALSDRLAQFAMRPRTRERILRRNRQISSENLATLTAWVARHPETLRIVPPQIGGLAFVGYDLDIGPTDLVMKLLKEHSVLVVPGDAFGADKYLRIGYGSPLLLEALDLIEPTLDALKSSKGK